MIRFQSRRERLDTGDGPVVESIDPLNIHHHHHHHQRQHPSLFPPPPVPRIRRNRRYHPQSPFQEQQLLYGASNGRDSSTRVTRSSNHSRSQPTTAPMTDRSISSAKVPSVVHSAATVSRFSDRFSDDETSWVSGVESHSRSNGGLSCVSSNSRSRRNPYSRSGKAIKRIIDGLTHSEDTESTLTALSIMCSEFDHDDTIKHNAELYYGSVRVLAHKLCMTDHHDGIRMICAAMEMTFRGGQKYVKEAFHVNAPLMMPPMLRLLDRAEQSKVRYADDIILNITKIFRYLSRIPDLRVSLARQPGLLDSLQRVATSPLNVPSRNTRVRVIANLANCNDNKVLMYAHRGLLTSLLKIAQLDPVDSTREYATIALMDLASATANQVPLARNGQVLQVLTSMIVSDEVATIRESATTTIQNLAFPKSNRLRLIEFQGGIVLEALLTALKKDNKGKARRRAGGALTNLACDETAERMAKHPTLLSSLAQVSVHEDTDADVQSRACLALTKIASSIGIGSEIHGALLDALVIASDAKVDNNISSVFRIWARDPKCRATMARHPHLLEKLADMCLKPTWKDKENATRALMHLANESINQKIMCTNPILKGLVHAATCSVPPQLAPHPDHDPLQMLKETQDSAVRAIARLATEVSNRRFMAKHDGLLVAIAKAAEREACQETEKMSVEQQQSSLSKALLMSLVVSI